MNKIDKRTLEIIDERYGLVNVMGDVLGYLQELNKELREVKCVLSGIAGFEVHQLSSEQKKKLREGGDAITGILKIIEKGKDFK